MDEDIKRDLKNIARKTENRLAQSLLRWKYRKEGREEPEEPSIKRESEAVVSRANSVLASRGKRAWAEIKKAYNRSGNREGGDG